MSGICITDTRMFETQVLPKLPTGSMNIWQKISQGKLEYRELEQIVETDPILSGEVLKITNSSFYGLQGKVGSVLRAIILLGNQTIRSLVRGLILRKAKFESSHLTNEQQQSIWSHNMATAILARSIAVQSNICDPEEAFLTGLLHDLGKLINPGKLPALFRECEFNVRKENHVEYATLLCAHWNMPESISQSILWHHQPVELAAKEIGNLHSVLRVANTLAKIAGYSAEETCLVDITTLESYFRLQGKMEYLRQALVHLPESYKSLSAPFNLPVNEVSRQSSRNTVYVGLDIHNPCDAYLLDLMLFNRGYTPAVYYGPRQDNLKISLLIHDDMNIRADSPTLSIPSLSLFELTQHGVFSLDSPTSMQIEQMTSLIDSHVKKEESHE